VVKSFSSLNLFFKRHVTDQIEIERLRHITPDNSRVGVIAALPRRTILRGTLETYTSTAELVQKSKTDGSGQEISSAE
jgi:hypothetical protein